MIYNTILCYILYFPASLTKEPVYSDIDNINNYVSQQAALRDTKGRCGPADERETWFSYDSNYADMGGRSSLGLGTYVAQHQVGPAEQHYMTPTPAGTSQQYENLDKVRKGMALI